MTGKRVVVLAVVLAASAAAGVAAWRRAHPAPVEEAAAAATPPAQQFWQAYTAARAARAAGRLDDAIAGYSKALAIRPDHEDSLYYLGHCYLEERNYAAALESYHRLVDVSPRGSSRAYMQIALIHASLDPAAPVDLVKARQYFDRALALDPDSGALLGLGEVALLEGRSKEARDTLLRVEADNPMSIAAPYLLGYIAFKAGDRAGAWRFFGTAVGRGVLKKPTVKWTEEGDIKADPALRWRALARQSVFGEHWMRLRAYLPAPGATEADMIHEYSQLDRGLEEARRARAPRP